jgi:hypothetical protein
VSSPQSCFATAPLVEFTYASVASNVAATSRPDSYADIRLGDYCVGCKVSANKAGNQKYSESKIGTSKNSYSPVSTSLASAILNSDGSKLIFKWSKQTTVDGYQLEYATDSSFKKAQRSQYQKAQRRL